MKDRKKVNKLKKIKEKKEMKKVERQIMKSLDDIAKGRVVEVKL
jgi:hypothetical protein